MLRSLGGQVAPDRGVTVFCGRFETLPSLERIAPDGDAGAATSAGRASVEGSSAVNLRDLGPFDAAIMGLTSFTHLRHDTGPRSHARGIRVRDQRTNCPKLLPCARPTAISPHDTRPRRRGLGRLVASRLTVPAGDHFSVGIGYYHTFRRDELEQLFERASLSVLHMEPRVELSHAVVNRL